MSTVDVTADVGAGEEEPEVAGAAKSAIGEMGGVTVGRALGVGMGNVDAGARGRGREVAHGMGKGSGDNGGGGDAAGAQVLWGTPTRAGVPLTGENESRDRECVQKRRLAKAKVS